MGDRLGRFGLATEGGALTPGTAEQFVLEQLMRSFALQQARAGAPSAPTSGFDSFLQARQGGAGRNPFVPQQSTANIVRQQTDALNAALQSRGLTGGFTTNPIAPIPLEQRRGVSGGAGAELFNQGFFGQTFGTGERVGSSQDIASLFPDEEQGLAAIRELFGQNPNLGQQVFRSGQNIADQLQKIRDQKISGGNVLGPLKVLTAGIGFPGAAQNIIGRSLPSLSSFGGKLPLGFENIAQIGNAVFNPPGARSSTSFSPDQFAGIESFLAGRR